MGLLDYLNKGFDNSVGHLNNLKDSFANQPKMYDPHANAQALMGGQAMQYNQQPQSLIGGSDTTVAPAEPSLATAPIDRVDYNYPQPQPTQSPNLDTISPFTHRYNHDNGVQEMWSGGGYTPEAAPEVAPYNPAMVQPEVSPYGSAPQQGIVGVESAPPVATTSPYTLPPSLIGETFDPSMTEEERLAREAAKANLPWYLGGKR